MWSKRSKACNIKTILTKTGSYLLSRRLTHEKRRYLDDYPCPILYSLDGIIWMGLIWLIFDNQFTFNWLPLVESVNFSRAATRYIPYKSSTNTLGIDDEGFMQLEPKQVTCKCGNTFETDRKKSWCRKCCRPVFYDVKDNKYHTINTIYVMVMICSALTFLAYLFVELIAVPLQ